MKKIVTLCIVLGLFLFSGCASEETPVEPLHLTLIATQQSNQPAPSLNLIENDLTEVVESYGSVTLIKLDGSPALVNQITVPAQEGLLTGSQRQRIAAEQVVAIQQEASQVHAVEPECDLLAALRLAGRAAQPTEEGRNVLIVFSNGINTMHPLDMSQTVIQNMDIERVVQELVGQMALPDLSAYSEVKFLQIGETSAPQDPLTPADTNVLKEFWRAVCVASGLSEEQISFPDMPSTSTVVTLGDLPPIKTVTVLQPASAISENMVNVSFNDQTVAFIPDQAELMNPQDAQSALLPTAEALKANPSMTVLIVGQTATTVDQESSLSLSRERANTITELLIEMGVPANQLQAIGLGCESQNPLHCPDTAEDGSLLEEQAQKNRIVSVISADTSLGKKLLTLADSME